MWYPYPKLVGTPCIIWVLRWQMIHQPILDADLQAVQHVGAYVALPFYIAVMSTHFKIPKMFVSDNCIWGWAKFLTFSKRQKQSLRPFFKFVQPRKISPKSPNLYQKTLILSKSRLDLKNILRKGYFSLFIQNTKITRKKLTI